MEPGINVWIKGGSTLGSPWVAGVIIAKATKTVGFELEVACDTGSKLIRLGRENTENENIKLRNIFSDATSNVDNLSDLPILNEPEILQFLSDRFSAEKLYTYFGPILISIIPNNIGNNNLYDDKTLEKFSDDTKKGNQNKSAHVWDIASIVYAQIKRTLPPEETLTTTLTSTSTDSLTDMLTFTTDNIILSPKAESAAAPSSIDLNHSILISGESGSGKSESFKFILKYLVHESQNSEENKNKNTKKQGLKRHITRSFSFYNNIQTNIVDKILLANSVLEAFGCAKTTRNLNSSRFGKYVEVGFNHRGILIGGSIRSYLLENGRVASQPKGERNFHIFYQLVAGATQDERRQFSLGAVEDYPYLTQGKSKSGGSKGGDTAIDDKDDFECLREHLNDLSFDEELVDQLLQIIAGILHLSQITFQKEVDVSGEKSKIVDNSVLRKAARLCGLDPADLEQLLLVKASMFIRGEAISRQMTVAQSFITRDAVAKAIYSRVFDWIVKEINEKIAPQEDSGKTIATVSILDIFGFESTCTRNNNGFDDLCINFANETLQNHFNRTIHALACTEYALQFDQSETALNAAVLDFSQNRGGLDLIDKYIFSILDEQCRIPNITDKKFASTLYSKCSAKPVFQASSVDQAAGMFNVVHFAGTVQYDTRGFIEKNLDEVSITANTLVETSELSILAGEIPEDSDEEGDEDGENRNSNGKAKGSAPGAANFTTNSSTAGKFKAQLSHLMQAIELTTPQYIRCVKPAEQGVAGFSHKRVLEQLQFSGVLSAAQIYRSSYQIKLKFSDFLARYRLLSLLMNNSALAVNQVHLSVGSTKNSHATRSQCVALLTNLSQFTQKKCDLVSQVGKSRIYLRSADYVALESYRAQSVTPAKNTIVKAYRAMVALRRMKAEHKRICHIHAAVRMFITRKRFLRFRSAVVSMQRLFLHRKNIFHASQVFNGIRNKVKRIQRSFRRYQAVLYVAYVRELNTNFEKQNADLIEARRLRHIRRAHQRENTAMFTSYNSAINNIASSTCESYSSSVFGAKMLAFKEQDNLLCMELSKLMTMSLKPAEDPHVPVATEHVNPTSAAAADAVPASAANQAAESHLPVRDLFAERDAVTGKLKVEKSAVFYFNKEYVGELMPFKMPNVQYLLKTIFSAGSPQQSAAVRDIVAMVDKLDYGHKLLVHETWKPASLTKKLFGSKPDHKTPYIPVTSIEHPMFATIAEVMSGLQKGIVFMGALPPDPDRNINLRLNRIKTDALELLQKMLGYYEAYVEFMVKEYGPESSFRAAYFSTDSYYYALAKRVKDKVPMLSLEQFLLVRSAADVPENKATEKTVDNVVSGLPPVPAANGTATASSSHSTIPLLPPVAPLVKPTLALTPMVNGVTVLSGDNMLYFRAPVAPGVDFALNSFHHLLCGGDNKRSSYRHSLHSIRLIKTRAPQSNRVKGVSKPASTYLEAAYYREAVELQPLARLLSTAKELPAKPQPALKRHYTPSPAAAIESLNYTSVSSLIVAHIVTGVVDVSPEHLATTMDFIGRHSSSDGSGEVSISFHHMNCDGAAIRKGGVFNFREESILKQFKSREEPPLNVLFFLPHMDEPVDANVRGYLIASLSSIAEEITASWAKYAYMQNMHFDSLPRVGYSPKELANLSLPLRFPKGTAVALYRRLQVLGDLLASTDSNSVPITHHMVLATFYPELAKFYFARRVGQFQAKSRVVGALKGDVVDYIRLYEHAKTKSKDSVVEALPLLQETLSLRDFHRQRLQAREMKAREIKAVTPRASPTKVLPANQIATASVSGTKNIPAKQAAPQPQHPSRPVTKAAAVLTKQKSVSFYYHDVYESEGEFGTMRTTGTTSTAVSAATTGHDSSNARGGPPISRNLYHSNSEISLEFDNIYDDGLDFTNDDSDLDEFDEFNRELDGESESCEDLVKEYQTDGSPLTKPESRMLSKRSVSFGFDQVYGAEEDASMPADIQNNTMGRVGQTNSVGGGKSPQLMRKMSSKLLMASNMQRTKTASTEHLLITLKSCVSFRFDEVYGAAHSFDERDEDVASEASENAAMKETGTLSAASAATSPKYAVTMKYSAVVDYEEPPEEFLLYAARIRRERQLSLQLEKGAVANGAAAELDHSRVLPTIKSTKSFIFHDAYNTEGNLPALTPLGTENIEYVAMAEGFANTSMRREGGVQDQQKEPDTVKNGDESGSESEDEEEVERTQVSYVTIETSDMAALSTMHIDVPSDPPSAPESPQAAHYVSSIAEIAADFVKKIDFSALSNTKDPMLCYKLLRNLSFLSSLWLYGISESQLVNMFSKDVLFMRQRHGLLEASAADKQEAAETDKMNVREVNIVLLSEAAVKKLRTSAIVADIKSVLNITVNFFVDENSVETTEPPHDETDELVELLTKSAYISDNQTPASNRHTVSSAPTTESKVTDTVPLNTASIIEAGRPTISELLTASSHNDELMSVAEHEDLLTRAKAILKEYILHPTSAISRYRSVADRTEDAKAVKKVVKSARLQSTVDNLNPQYLNTFAEVLLEHLPLMSIAIELAPLGVLRNIPKLLYSCITHNDVENYVDLIRVLVAANPDLLTLRDRLDNLRACDYLKRLNGAVKCKYSLLCFCVNESFYVNDAKELSASKVKRQYQPVMSSYASEEELVVRAVSYGLPATETELRSRSYNFSKVCGDGETILFKCLSMLSGARVTTFDTDFHMHTFLLIIEALSERSGGDFDANGFIWDTWTNGGETVADLLNRVGSQKSEGNSASDAAMQSVIQELSRNWKRN